MNDRSPSADVVVAISGATRGLGLVTAAFLAGQGANVAVCSRSQGEAEATAEFLRNTHGVKTLGASVDVCDADAVREFAQCVEDRVGPIDVLINNAAILGPVGDLANVSMTAWSETINVNLNGVVNMTAAFTGQLARSTNGRVINLSGGGVGGPDPMRRASAYTTSKYAVVGLTEVLARDLEHTGITVNAVAPGALPTTFLDEIVAVGPEQAGAAVFEDAFRRTQIHDRNAAVQSSAEPFLALVAYLISPGSAWLSGRLLSARWDHPAGLDRQSNSLADAHFKLRRIDNDLFAERVK